MLEPGKDFTIDEEHGIIRCVPSTDEARATFKVLQLRLQKLVGQLPDAPQVTINIDGVIGPAATLVAQAIVLRMSEGAHQEFMAFAVAQPETAIPLCGAMAMELSGYLDQVMTDDPHALASPTPPPEPQLDILGMIKGYFTKKRTIAAGAALCGLGGLALVARASQRRALGVIDRSGMLPPSDGTDAMDDDDYEVDDAAPADEHAA